MAIEPAVKFLKEWLHAEHPRAQRRRLIAAGVALFLLWGLFGGQQGLFALVSSQREKGQLRAEIDQLSKDNAALQGQLSDVSRHPELYEKVAREKLMLMRPGEVLYRFHD
jgi:cell division protein FtsB